MDFLKEIRAEVRISFVTSGQALDGRAELGRNADVALILDIGFHSPRSWLVHQVVGGYWSFLQGRAGRGAAGGVIVRSCASQ